MTATVRRRPNLASRRKSGIKPGVIYLNEEWIGQMVKVLPLASYHELITNLREAQRSLYRIREASK